jgi:hypothetical protein
MTEEGGDDDDMLYTSIAQDMCVEVSIGGSYFLLTPILFERESDWRERTQLRIARTMFITTRRKLVGTW